MVNVNVSNSSIGEAWASDRPIFYRLPGENEIYSEPDGLGDILCGFWDEHLILIRDYLDNIPLKQLNPLTADADWVEFLAPLFGWDKPYWNPNWSLASKRTLLANSYSGQSIWETKGSLSTISFVLSAVGIRNIVSNRGDFLVGISEVGDPIGIDPWAYRIYLPPSYQNQPQYVETLRLNALFGPAWCDWDIVFDTERFDLDYILTNESGESITSEEGESLLMFQEDG